MRHELSPRESSALREAIVGREPWAPVGEIHMFGTVIYVLVIWTAMSFATALAWTILCRARDGMLMHRPEVRTEDGGSARYDIGHRRGSA
jgi:hypothetical protein